MGKSTGAAQALVEAFFRTVPEGKKKQKNEVEWANSLSKFYLEAKEIRQRYSLGIFSRAATAYKFQRLLLKAGFDANTARQVVFSLVLNAFIG